ncbi:FmdB family transcriptional regulator [Janibacter melonis]|uniref:FmdB family transcriptional regulator n=1 Tax=Janibacter melonis TaxID=262209 RepID=A0A5P8FMY3_9MICO|nr:FmdB family zinc ribbon protein [Janibacter melonis]QFQ30979.1 FmdB family transcriptional regulator [Janibacter melonis]
MPTYAYACADCGHAFDAVQSFSDDALTQCPECGGTLRKKFGSVGVVFKGGGFYRNDSRAANGSSSGSSTSSSATSSSTSSESTSSSSDSSSTSSTSSSSASSTGTSSTSTSSTPSA